MIGNFRECNDWHQTGSRRMCVICFDLHMLNTQIAHRIINGASHSCAVDHCRRYRADHAEGAADRQFDLRYGLPLGRPAEW
jgi:hypothetical protein